MTEPSVTLEEWDRWHVVCASEQWWSLGGTNPGDPSTAARAEAAVLELERNLDRLEAQRKDAFSRGWPECSRARLQDCAPRKPGVYLGEPSPYSWGVGQDLWGGGFFQQEVGPQGKRRLRPASELAPIFWGEAMDRYMAGVKRLAAAGKIDGARVLIVPYVFTWANQIQAQAQGLSTGTPEKPGDGRRPFPSWQVPPARGFLTVGSMSAAEQLAKLEAINPEVWPKDHVWKPDPYASTPNTPHDDPTDPAVQTMALFYWERWLAALRVQAPWVKVIVQLSSCVQGLSPDDIWAREMTTALPKLMRLYGFGTTVQLEACNARWNRERGQPWNAHFPDCSILQLVERDPKTKVVVWSGAGLRAVDQEYAECPRP